MQHHQSDAAHSQHVNRKQSGHCDLSEAGCPTQRGLEQRSSSSSEGVRLLAFIGVIDPLASFVFFFCLFVGLIFGLVDFLDLIGVVDFLDLIAFLIFIAFKIILDLPIFIGFLVFTAILKVFFWRQLVNCSSAGSTTLANAQRPTKKRLDIDAKHERVHINKKEERHMSGTAANLQS